MAKKKIKNIKTAKAGPPYFKRVIAFGLDWYLSSVLLNLVIRLVLGLFDLTDKEFNIISYDGPTKAIMIIASLLVAFIYFVYIPHATKKKSTPGMKVMRLEFLKADGSSVDFNTLFKRFFLGSFIIQGVLYTSFNTIAQVLSKSISENKLNTVDYIIAIPTTIIILISCYMAYKDKNKGQTIQDRIGKTYVNEI